MEDIVFNIKFASKQFERMSYVTCQMPMLLHTAQLTFY